MLFPTHSVPIHAVLCRCRFSTFKRWEWAVSEEELSMQSQNQPAQLLTLYKHTSFSFQSQFPWILPSHGTAKMASDCNCAVNSCLWEHGVKQGVNLTEIIHMPPDGHNIQSLLDLNQRWEWKLFYYKHLISANAWVHMVNVNTPFRFRIENRLPFIIESENLVWKYNGLRFKPLKSVLYLLSPLWFWWG